MTLPIAHIYNGELGFDVRTKLNDLIDLAGGGSAPWTQGSIPFADASGFLIQQNTNLFFDDPNNALKIGPSHTYNIDTYRALYRVANIGGDNWFEGDAGNTTLSGYQNFGTGTACMINLTSGIRNTGLGDHALWYLQSGTDNMAVGSQAGYSINDGIQNVAIGHNSLSNGQHVDLNVAIGDGALKSLGISGSSENNNVAIGADALSKLQSGLVNVGIGSGVGGLSSGNYNTFVGWQSAAATTGSCNFNTVIGGLAGGFATSLSKCTVIGGWAGPAASLSNIIVINDGSGTSFSPSYNAPALDWNYTNNNIWSFRRSTSAQGLHVYNTQDDATPTGNYERGVFDWNVTTNVLMIGTQAGGTGVKRLIAIDGFAKAGAPAAGDLPSGSFALIDDTSAGQTWLVFNKAGTIRKVQLT